MSSKPFPNILCPNPNCTFYGQLGKANILRHSFIRLKRGKRRRYRCRACGKTFCSSTSTPYHRLHHSRKTFDEVVLMSVEGISKSSIARIKGLSWNTVARWLERAAAFARRFNNLKMQGYELIELQADEIRTFILHKDNAIWVFTALEVWSRLWPSTVVGQRSYRNARLLIRDTVHRARLERLPLVTTDGFQYYHAVVRRLFGHACVYGQVMKTWRNNRVARIDRRVLIGSNLQFEHALSDSEDSVSLNTAFVERLNLTVRRGSAYLCRKTPCHARYHEHLEDRLELLRCYHNFVRPHLRLKFGKVVRTPAMQAGLVARDLTFREIFTSVAGLFIFVALLIDFVAGRHTLHKQRLAA